MQTSEILYPDMTHDDKIQAIYTHVERIMGVLPKLSPYFVENLLVDIADLENNVLYEALQREQTCEDKASQMIDIGACG